MAQDLFKLDNNGTSEVYDQTQILDAQNNVDSAKLDAYGVPWFATSNALFLMTS